MQLLCRQSARVIPTNLAVTKTITGLLPATKVCLPENQLTCFKIADPNFGTPGPIDRLIGANRYDTIVLSERIKLQNRLFLRNTLCGWMLSGSLSSRVKGDLQRSFHVAIDPSVNQSSANDPLTSFREIEEIPKKRFLTPEEEQCEQIFKDTTRRCADGRFSVSLPFISEAKPVGDSFQQAQRRFLSLERLLEKQPILKERYSKFLNEFIDLDHLEIVTVVEIEKPDNEMFYLPHHCVEKEPAQRQKCVWPSTHPPLPLQAHLSTIFCLQVLDFKMIFSKYYSDFGFIASVSQRM